jgi:hypothetical protein
MITADARRYNRKDNFRRVRCGIRSGLHAQRLIDKESRLRNSSSEVGTVNVGPPDGADALPAPPFASFCGVKSRSLSDLVFLS